MSGFHTSSAGFFVSGIVVNSNGTFVDLAKSLNFTSGFTLTTNSQGDIEISSTGGGGSGITSLNGLISTSQTFAIPGTSGLSPNWVSSTSTHTLNIPLASAAGVTAGLLSKSDYDIFNAKEPAITILPISKGGTNSSTSLSNNRNIISSGGAIVEAAAITANRAIVSNASGIPVHSLTTDTEIGFISGLTSAVQSQLNSKEPTITATTSADYYRGDKTFQNLNSAVIASTLTAFSASPGNVTSSDSVLTAIQKLLGNTNIGGVAEIHAGSINPSVSGFTAPYGSLYLQNTGSNGSLWIKRGSADTDWSEEQASIKNLLVVQKNPSAGEYSSINTALAAISGNSISNPFVIYVGPGVYVETTITVPSFVYIQGAGEKQTIVNPASPSQNIFELKKYSSISDMFISGATASGFCGVHYVDATSTADDSASMENIRFGANDTHAKVESTGNITFLLSNNVKFGGTFAFTHGFVATGDSARIQLRNSTTIPTTVSTASEFLLVDGPNCQGITNSCQWRTGVVGGTVNGIEAINGGTLRLNATNLNGFNYAIYMPSVGAATTIAANSINFENNNFDVEITHPSATGHIIGVSDYEKTVINDSNSVFISGKDSKIITVAKKGGDFTSISAACASIVGPAATNRYVVSVGPGIFDEPQIDVPTYTSVVGTDIQSTVVRPIANNQILFNISTGTELVFITLDNSVTAFTGTIGVQSIDQGNFTQMHKMSIYGFDTCVHHKSLTQDCFLYMEYVDIDNIYTTGIKCESSGGFVAYVNTENWYTYPDVGNTGDNVLVDGPNATVDINAFGINGTGLDNGVRVTNGGASNIQGGYFNSTGIGVYSDSTGSGSNIIGSGVTHVACAIDIKIDNANTTGSWTGAIDHEKLYIDPSSPFYVSGRDLQIVTVAKRGGDHTSIKDAIDTITDASSSKPYVVQIGPGIYIENTITMKQFVYVRGIDGDQSVVIQAASTSQKIIIGIDNSGIENVLLTGATGATGVAVYHEGTGTSVPFIIKNSLFGDNYTQAQVFGNTQISILQVNECRMGGPYNFTNGFIASSNTGIPTQLSIENLIYQDVVAPYPTGDFINISGASTALVTSGLFARVLVPTGNGLVISDGAQARVSGLSLRGFLKGIWAKNVGTGPFIETLASALEGNTQDIQIDHPGTTGSFFGNAMQSKIYKDPTATGFSLLFQDPSNGSMGLTGTVKLGFSDNTYQDVSTLIIEASTMGVMEGGVLSDGGGLVVNVATGFGYLEIEPEIIRRYDWTNSTITIPANDESYIYFDSNGTLTSSLTKPDTFYNIYLGRVISGAASLLIIDNSGTKAEHTSNRYEKMFDRAFGPIYASGSAVTENVTPFHLDVTGGEYYFATNMFAPTGGTNINFYEIYNNSIHETPANAVQVVYDNAGTLTPLSASKYAKHSLYVSTDGANEKYLLVYATAFYNTLLLAEGADIAAPPSFADDAMCLIATIIVQDGHANIVEILDSRPRIGFKASGTSASSDHQALSNRDALTAHSQYLLKANTDSMGIDLNMGGFSVTNVNLVDGVDVSAHESRHLPNGADPLTTAAPTTNLNGSSTNSVGIQNSLSRSDHSHAIDNATISVAGLMSTSDKTKLNAIGGARVIKSGTVAGSSFAGNPKTFAVVFGTAFASTAYTISIISDTNRTWTYSSKATTGFTISANSNTAFASGTVDWIAINTGESVE